MPSEKFLSDRLMLDKINDMFNSFRADKTYGARVMPKKNLNAGKISYIRDLTEREAAILSSELMTQMLYKFTGTLNTFKFNLAMSRLVSENEAMRTNFFDVGDKTVAVIFDRRDRLPEIIFQNVQNIEPEEIDAAIRRLMEADRRCGFELHEGALIRFIILHTAQTEYAILVTMSQVLVDAFDLEKFFRDALELESDEVERRTSYSPTMFNRPQIEASIRDYWAKILANLPQTQLLPHIKNAASTGRQHVYRELVPVDIMSEIRGRAQSNKLMTMTILQTAWGLMLQHFNASNDAVFCTLAPSEGSDVMVLNTIPVRLKCADDLTVQHLIGMQFQQLIVSKKFSRFDWAALKELVDKPELFNHFLNFTDFISEGRQFSEAKNNSSLELVSQNSWNTKDNRLGIYFACNDDEVSIQLRYDRNQSGENDAILLLDRYLLTLQQMMTDWALPIGTFKERLTTRLKAEASKQSLEDDNSRLQHFISKTTMLQGITVGTIQSFMKVARLDTRFEGDRVSGAELEENLVFAADGILARSIDTGDGWYNTLDMVTTGLPINETCLLETPRCKVSAEVVSDRAVLLLIPLDEMKNILKVTPELWQNIAIHALGEMENFQSIWVQS